jgi:glycine/D-amino acid oxidase-like deaminating enzyme
VIGRVGANPGKRLRSEKSRLPSGAKILYVDGMRDYRDESFWFASGEMDLAPRPSLQGDHRADVVIVGGGFSGLWTAYALKERDASLEVAICESDIVGAGASGRNGGWCMGALSGLPNLLLDRQLGGAAIRLQHRLFETVDAIGVTIKREKIDCDFVHGGSLGLASLPEHLQVIENSVRALQQAGFGDADFQLLGEEACAGRIRSRKFLGALYSVHSAVLNPGKLVRGLARTVERMGVRIFEGSRATALSAREVTTAHGCIRAEKVVMATEGYTPLVAAHKRRLIPIHSMMIATERIPAEIWREIGLEGRETFADKRRVTVYGQRTADDRIAFGGRGLYFFGSRAVSQFSVDNVAFDEVRRAMLSLLPQLQDTRISHRWGGPLGVPRDWRPAYGIDDRTGVAFLGGYVGEGVAGAHLLGHALADRLLDRPNELETFPFLHKKFPNWEPEPLRWLGVSLVRRMGELADQAEFAGRRNPLAASLFGKFAGR